jgi:hypothetical protein
MIRVPGRLGLLAGALLLTPYLAMAESYNDVDVAVFPVQNRSGANMASGSSADGHASAIRAPGAPGNSAGNAVEITSLTSVEPDQAGFVHGSSSFFFPADQNRLADFLGSPDGVAKLMKFFKKDGVIKASADGKSWTGQATFDVNRISGKEHEVLWTDGARAALAARKDHPYSASFQVSRNDSEGASTIRYSQLPSDNKSGTMDVEVRVKSNGTKLCLVTVDSKSLVHGVPDKGERALIAKRFHRGIPAVLDKALN